MRDPIASREDIYVRSRNEFRDAVGQAHFPDEKLGATEITCMNPWTLKKIPAKPITWPPKWAKR